MKKILSIIITLICTVSLVACQNDQSPADELASPVLAVMYDGKLYCSTDKQIPAEVDESAIIGTITSTVPPSQWPTEEGQANFEAMDAPYALVEEGLVVLVDNEWTLFEVRELSGGIIDTDNQEKEPDADIQSEDSLQQEETLDFSEISNYQFNFLSGAGGWATYMSIDEDGTFSGEYFDGNLGDTGEGYPNGTTYRCDFTGQFTTPVKVNDYTYSMQIQDISYAKEPGTEEIIDGMLYCYITPYGLDGAEDILIYLPGAPLAELPQEFRSWVGYYDLTQTEETELPFYALYNEAPQCGFYSYTYKERAYEIVEFREIMATNLENAINNDVLSQNELNMKSQELYEEWDWALNDLWSLLKKVLSEEEMETLTIEEREWITMKEEAVKEAGLEFEGGSMQPMLENLTAARLTKERVYELLELFE